MDFDQIVFDLDLASRTVLTIVDVLSRCVHVYLVHLVEFYFDREVPIGVATRRVKRASANAVSLARTSVSDTYSNRPYCGQ